MRIEMIEVTAARLALAEPVQSAGLRHHSKPTVFLHVVTSDGEGWGECAATEDTRDPDPPLQEVEPAVIDLVVARLFAACRDGELPAADSVVELCRPNRVAERMSAAALEMAVFDAELRAEGRSIVEVLSVGRSTVETGAVVGIPADRSLDRLVEAVGLAVGTGARRVRVKIEPGWASEPLGVIRSGFPDLDLQADANGSFDPADDAIFRSLEGLGLRCLEQPFGPEEMAAHVALAERLSIPIALDESLSSPDRVRAAVASGACSVACLKPGRLGGVFATMAAAAVCAEGGVQCFMGGVFESGLGRAVNAAVAGRTEFGIPGDLSDPDSYLSANPFSYLPTGGGEVRLSGAPGLGAEVRPEVLRSATESTRRLIFGS
jgi:O-succinylbenzoate synthase